MLNVPPPPPPITLSWHDAGGVVADSPLVFFADESGSTGTNHLDPLQQRYVTAGWLLRLSDVPRAETATARALASTDLAELKGSKLTKTTSGVRQALALISDLFEFCTPLLIILDKRYALCTRATEMFLLYPGNPLGGGPHPDREVSRSYASALYALPDEVLLLLNSYMNRPKASLALE